MLVLKQRRAWNMTAALLDKVIKEIGELRENEQEYLIVYLAHNKGRTKLKENDKPKWMDIAGTGKGLLDGEDAQEWVKKGRLESDIKRNIEGFCEQ
jgi:hypothetical protein